MRDIDLVKYSVFSQKIPAAQLNQLEQKKPDTNLNFILATSFDFALVTIMTFCFEMSVNNSLEVVFSTSSNLSQFFKSGKSTSIMALLPLTTFCYFFFSMFLAHGQTIGLHFIKKRIPIQNKSFLQSLFWAREYLFLLYSGGITYLFRKEVWNRMVEHDHLYLEMVYQIKDVKVDLLEMLKSKKELLEVKKAA